MSFRFRAWPWECIIALKKELDYALHLYMTRDGDTIHTQRRKYSNPDNHRSPIIKCPLCGKNLYAVFNAQVKNDCIPFDADDPKYRELEYQLPLLLNVKQLAALLGVSDSSVYELIEEEDFPSLRIGKRIVIPKEELRKWIT